jgi:DNA-binding XRE family transcriptional regulator
VVDSGTIRISPRPPGDHYARDTASQERVAIHQIRIYAVGRKRARRGHAIVEAAPFVVNCRKLMINTVLDQLGLVTALKVKRVHELRAAKEWSQEEFAHISGLHDTYIGQIERGEKNISFGNLSKIASVLGVTLSELLSGLEDGTA